MVWKPVRAAALAFVTLLIWGDAARGPAECIAEDMFVPEETYFPTHVQVTMAPREQLSDDQSVIDSAALFNIAYGPQFKVVTDHYIEEQYVLTQCGAGAPSDAEVDTVAPNPGDYRRKNFTIPLQKVASGSTVQMSFLHELGLHDRVLYPSPYSVSPCWQAAVECGGGYTNAADKQDEVDAMFLDTWEIATAGDNAIHCPVSYEPGALQSSEYIKFMAVFFNKEAEANSFFDEVKEEYEAIKTVGDVKVAWISKQMPSQWDSSELFIISLAGYKQRVITDAGGVNVNSNDVKASLGASVTVTEATAGSFSGGVFGETLKVDVASFASTQDASDAFFAELADVDVVIDETYVTDTFAYAFADFLTMFNLDSSSSLPFIANGKVFRTDGSMSNDGNNDWFESRMARADLFLADLIRATSGASSDPYRFLRNLATPDAHTTLSEGECDLELPACTGDDPVEIPMLYLPYDDSDPDVDPDDGEGDDAAASVKAASYSLGFVTALGLAAACLSA